MLDLFPLNLVLAVAVASATIFLGFLPARNLRGDFFARQVLKAGLIWVLIGLGSASGITHDHIVIALVCFTSWWQLRRERALSGKMGLILASGLGISIGVMLILITTPLAYPFHNLSERDRWLLLVSLYLGGAVVGLSSVCFILTKNLSTNESVTPAVVRRYVGLLGFLVIARGLVLLVSYCVRKPVPPQLIGSSLHGALYGLPIQDLHLAYLLFILVLIVLPLLTFVAMRATRADTSARASSALIAVGVVGFFAECIARLLVI